ncbi:MAG TPA: beta-ketoacyl synthase N-terminal-like domain-containing protein, partial [Desulfatirhabdiaceae bacterium]|nr:beta-ketoacyl synthase N-terminal-like domain-containing protein [Desulfatirhabdiaceae bacterium]
MTVFINGIGVVGGFGCGIQRLEQAVIKQNIRNQETGAFGRDDTGVASSPQAADTALLSLLIPQKALRRVDHYSRMAILAGWLALTNAQNDEKTTRSLSEPMGVIVSTGWGPTARACDSQSSDSDGLHLSPIRFSNSVHNAAAAYISMLLKIRGPNLSINQYDMSVPLAFQTA